MAASAPKKSKVPRTRKAIAATRGKYGPRSKMMTRFFKAAYGGGIKGMDHSAGEKTNELDGGKAKQDKQHQENGKIKGAGEEQKNSRLESKLNSARGKGSPMPSALRKAMEKKFGADFTRVRLHNDADATQLSLHFKANAFTFGNDIFFSEGQFNPESSEGKKLLAHELAHTLQQMGGQPFVQCDHVKDTGFRYYPPATVNRTVRQIQGIVGATPDGVYGQDTKNAVEKYQQKLKAEGLYKDVVDGKWGPNTEAAFLEFGQGLTGENYNCAGFAFKNYKYISQADTKTNLAGMTALADCKVNCKPWQYKFWFWEYDISRTNTKTGVTFGFGSDFHIVGGQTDGNGAGPSHVMSKNGARPVEGPKPASGWYPANSPLRVNDHTNQIVPDMTRNRFNVVERCYCADRLPT